MGNMLNELRTDVHAFGVILEDPHKNNIYIYIYIIFKIRIKRIEEIRRRAMNLRGFLNIQASQAREELLPHSKLRI